MADTSASLLVGCRVVLLDIEGTTTPIDFVYQRLFPFARTRCADFLTRFAGDGEVQSIVARLWDEYNAEEEPLRARVAWNAPTDQDGCVRYIHALMDEDRKSTGLKALQGRIWEEGFRSGDLRGQVFPDVPDALRRWQAAGYIVAIFSSGSVLAQQQLFGNSEAGDLSPFLSGYFDTTTGPKRESASYCAIAEKLGVSPTECLFLSDVREELDAAAGAGMRVALAVRPGNKPTNAGPHPTLQSLEGL